MTKWVAGFLFLFFLALSLFGLWWRGYFTTFEEKIISSQNNTALPFQKQTKEDIPLTTVIAENLEIPWSIAFLPTGGMLITERPGRVRYIDAAGNLQQKPIATIAEVKALGEGGLLGIAVHPDFAKNHFVYLYYTYAVNGTDTQNRVVRYVLTNNMLIDPKIIVDAIPGAANHNGGRIAFGPDGYLYITTGDAQEPSLAQNKQSLAGKILRVIDPSASSGQVKVEIYSYGHRNPQGIAWDERGKLWATEHGSSARDELNYIERGANYGWPIIKGNEKREGMQVPILNSGVATWAPAAAAYSKGSIFFGGLRGQTLYEAVVQENNVVAFKEHFKGEFGRIREVILGPDSMLYITTSNQDGRGVPKAHDDKIIRINPAKL